MKLKCLAVFFALCLIPFQVFAKEKQELAIEQTKLMLPLEMYTLYVPLANDLVKSIKLDALELNDVEKKALGSNIYQAILRNIFDCNVEAKVEVYTTQELTALIKHYQTDKGKYIINKIDQAGQNKKIRDLNDLKNLLTHDEKAYLENIQLTEAGKSAYNKAEKYSKTLMEKIQQSASKIGLKTSLLTSEALSTAEANRKAKKQ